MKTTLTLVHITTLLLFQRYALATSPPAAATAASAAAPTDAATKKHSVRTVCDATRVLHGHDGKIAQWTAHCHVEIWADKDQPVLEHLTPDGILQSRAKTSAAEPPLPPPQSQFYETQPLEPAVPAETAVQHPRMSLDELLRSIQFLVDQARLRHHECMETKAAIMQNVQRELPPSLHAKDEILAALNGVNVHLAPNVGLYIGHLDEVMKQKVADLHAVQNNPKLTPEQKKEALKALNIETRRHLDTHCQHAHPAIQHHGVTAAVPDNLHQMSVSLLLRRPENRVEILHLPSDAYGQHTVRLRSMAEAALHHARTTGEIGRFTVHSAAPDPAEEQALRTLAGYNHSGTYQWLQVPNTFVVQKAGDNKHDPGVVDSQQAGSSEAGTTAAAVPTNMLDATAAAAGNQAGTATNSHESSTTSHDNSSSSSGGGGSAAKEAKTQ